MIPPGHQTGGFLITTDNRTPEEKARQIAIAANCVKGMGAVFMLVAPLVAFNVFGLAELIGVRDGFFEYLMGGMLLVLGLIDFLVVPRLLTQNKKRDEPS